MPPATLHLTLTKRVLAVACDAFGVNETELLSPRRYLYLVRARWAVMYALRAAGWSYPRIGKWMGRDHATVINGIHKARELRRSDDDFGEALVEVVRAAMVRPVPVKAELVERYCRGREERRAA